MKWLPFSRRSKQSGSLVHDFDKKLIKNVSGRSIPNWRQLKYAGRFLSSAEKKLITFLICIPILAILISTSLFTITHAMIIPKEGGSYSEAMVGQPQYINPLFSSSNDIDNDLTSLIYSGLFRFDKEQKLIPDLAETSTISTDKKIYTITLKPGVVWSDGEPFSADDVLYTFETIQNPEVGSTLYPTFQGIEVEKINDLSLRFVLKEPFSSFLNSLTVGILPEHIWAPLSEATPANFKLTDNNLKPIGTGPWKFDKFIKKDDGGIQAYYLNRNESYYGKKPFLKTLSFEFFEDCNQAIQEVYNQRIEAMSFVSCKTKNELEKKHLSLYNVLLPQYTALFFNQENQEYLKDKTFRQALALGINKNTIISDALQGLGTYIDAPLLRGSIGFNAEIKKINFNPEEANATLDKKWTRIQPEEYFNTRQKALQKQFQETLKENSSSTTSTVTLSEEIQNSIVTTIRNEMPSTQTFYRKDKNGIPLQLIITTVEIPEYQKTAEVIKSQWEALGIQTSILIVKKSDIKKEILRNHSYQILLYGEIMGADSDLFPFWHSSQIEYPGLNLAQFSNRSADKLLEEARTTIDNKKREELYKEFQNILADELPAIFLNTPTYTIVVNKEIKGIEISYLISPADRFNYLSEWYKKLSWKWK